MEISSALTKYFIIQKRSKLCTTCEKKIEVYEPHLHVVVGMFRHTFTFNVCEECLRKGIEYLKVLKAKRELSLFPRKRESVRNKKR